MACCSSTIYNSSGEKELWKSDGTSAGTTFVKSLYTATDGALPGYLTMMNGMLYFVADDGAGTRELVEERRHGYWHDAGEGDGCRG